VLCNPTAPVYSNNNIRSNYFPTCDPNNKDYDGVAIIFAVDRTPAQDGPNAPVNQSLPPHKIVYNKLLVSATSDTYFGKTEPAPNQPYPNLHLFNIPVISAQGIGADGDDLGRLYDSAQTLQFNDTPGYYSKIFQSTYVFAEPVLAGMDIDSSKSPVAKIISDLMTAGGSMVQAGFGVAPLPFGSGIAVVNFTPSPLQTLIPIGKGFLEVNGLSIEQYQKNFYVATLLLPQTPVFQFSIGTMSGVISSFYSGTYVDGGICYAPGC
jgi:hypothetical protein